MKLFVVYLIVDLIKKMGISVLQLHAASKSRLSEWRSLADFGLPFEFDGNVNNLQES